jgi:hypothetical protein
VGKHAAPEGASADPIVAEALAHRSAPPVHHAAAESPVGWPDPPAPEGGGLGWPADADSAKAGQNGAVDGGAVDRTPEQPAPPVARRSWRRLLGVSRVA